MQTRGWISGLMAVVVGGSFAAGLFEPELRAHGGLPEIFSSLRPGGQGRELDPINTYNRVVQLVQEKYYGEAPTPLKMTHTAIRGLLNSLDDPYTRFLDPKEYADVRQENQGEFEGIGAQLENNPTKEGYVRISRPLPNGPAARAGIKRGDMITKIDGKPVPATVDEAVSRIRGKADTPVVLTIKREGQAQTVDIRIIRAPVEFEIVSVDMKPGNIGYIALHQFNEMADPRLEQEIRKLEAQGMQGLVLDLRGNPGGLLESAIDVTSRFVPNGNVVIIEEPGNREVRSVNARKHLRKWPLAILVNGTSASASEIVSGAVKHHKTGTIIGKTTFGKGLVQTLVPLEGGAACLITNAKYLMPSGKDINRGRDQRGGVEPDIVVDVTEEEWMQGKDPQLTKAVEVLTQQIRQASTR
jgi:carboxyl-terminal processing protease